MTENKSLRRKDKVFRGITASEKKNQDVPSPYEQRSTYQQPEEGSSLSPPYADHSFPHGQPLISTTNVKDAMPNVV